MDLWLLELFHGPTLAFKDVALQFLGNLFEYFLKRRSVRESITVVGATSGDTGSAAIYGLKGKENIQVVILHPKDKISSIQERQMTTVLDENIHNIAIEGSFDDCQDIVKALFRDSAFRKKYKLAAINSINWARILAQITYYFYAFFRVQEYYQRSGPAHSFKLNNPQPHRYHRTTSGKVMVEGNDNWKRVQFSVPSGNFGKSSIILKENMNKNIRNVLAGYYARCMGLPIYTLIVATNVNDVLFRFFQSGTYQKSSLIIPTLTPAMDIQISSNFERLLFHTACDNDPSALVKLFENFNIEMGFSISHSQLSAVKEGFKSFRVEEELVLDAIQRYYNRSDVSLVASNSNPSSSSSHHHLPLHTPKPLDPNNAVTVSTGPLLLDPHTCVGIVAAESLISQLEAQPLEELQLDLNDFESTTRHIDNADEALLIQQQNPLRKTNSSASSSSSRPSPFLLKRSGDDRAVTICIATAHPFKFPEAICNAINPFKLVPPIPMQGTKPNTTSKQLNTTSTTTTTINNTELSSSNSSFWISILSSIFGSALYTLGNIILSPIFQLTPYIKYPPSYRFKEHEEALLESFYERIGMLPPGWKGLRFRPVRCATLPNSPHAVKMFIEQLVEVNLYASGVSESESSSTLMSRL